MVACINRDGKIIIPGGNDKIQGGDTVIVVTTNTGFHDIEDILR
ncbi:MAG: TrkA C-terminal domain-containing protein [Eubacterium sp.]